MSETRWRKTSSYGTLSSVQQQSLWRAILCMGIRHRWQPGAPLTVFSRRAEYFFEFRCCTRCYLLQTRPRRSERFG